MSTPSITMPESDIRWNLPARGPVAMYCLMWRLRNYAAKTVQARSVEFRAAFEVARDVELLHARYRKHSFGAAWSFFEKPNGVAISEILSMQGF